MEFNLPPVSVNDCDAGGRSNAEHQDHLIFAEGIGLEDLSWSRSGASLVFTVSSGETITISNYFTADYYQIEAVELSDGTPLDLAQIELDVVTASESGGTL